MAKTAKQGGIKTVLKQIEQYIKMNGKDPLIAYDVKRGKTMHHGRIMDRFKPNKTMTIVIRVNGGAEDSEFAPPGCY